MGIDTPEPRADRVRPGRPPHRWTRVEDPGEVAVVAYPDERLGERGCAVILPDGEAPGLGELKDYLEKAGMARQFWPERLEIVVADNNSPQGIEAVERVVAGRARVVLVTDRGAGPARMASRSSTSS